MAVVVPVRMPVGVAMTMSMVVTVGGGRSGNHTGTLYYNIPSVHARSGFANHHCDGGSHKRERNRNGARNQTKRAGMNGISNELTRWKANSA